MISAENIVAAALGGPTNVILEVNSSHQIQGAAFALNSGVHGLLIPDDPDIVRAAVEAKNVLTPRENYPTSKKIDLVEATVTAVITAGIGDRVCIDLVQLLVEGEGILVGSSAKLLALVHGETFETGYVPARPFRINAGPVHSYVFMADSSMKYLSEVSAGDKVLVVKYSYSKLDNTCSISSRSVSVGRCKIESRPLLMVAFECMNQVGQVFLQQVETVRLFNRDSTVPVTALQKGDKIYVRKANQGTHLGRIIDVLVTER